MTTLTIHADDELAAAIRADDAGADLVTYDEHFKSIPMLTVIML